ncbi:unnamed protein product, partial [Mesorhabditis spiculigera]
MTADPGDELLALASASTLANTGNQVQSSSNGFLDVLATGLAITASAFHIANLDVQVLLRDTNALEELSEDLLARFGGTPLPTNLPKAPNQSPYSVKLLSGKNTPFFKEILQSRTGSLELPPPCACPEQVQASLVATQTMLAKLGKTLGNLRDSKRRADTVSLHLQKHADAVEVFIEDITAVRIRHLLYSQWLDTFRANNPHTRMKQTFLCTCKQITKDNVTSDSSGSDESESDAGETVAVDGETRLGRTGKPFRPMRLPGICTWCSGEGMMSFHFGPPLCSRCRKRYTKALTGHIPGAACSCIGNKSCKGCTVKKGAALGLKPENYRPRSKNNNQDVGELNDL